MDQGAEDRVVLVTGASGAIGREVAAQCGAQGWITLVHGRTPESAGLAAAALLERLPQARFHSVFGDFLAEGVVPGMVADIEARHGRLDGVVNCAASAPPKITGPFRDTDPRAYTGLCHHAITQLWWLCHAAFPLMAKGGGGSMIAVASDAGRFAAPNQSLIGSTRAAMMNFCRNVALEVGHEGIRVNCVSASYVEETPAFDAILARGGNRPETARRRAGLGLPKPADLAALCIFLLGPGSQRLTGQTISVNGGINA